MKKTGDFQVAGLVYLVEVEDLSSLTLSEEHDSYIWLGFDELNSLVPHFKKALEELEFIE